MTTASARSVASTLRRSLGCIRRDEPGPDQDDPERPEPEHHERVAEEPVAEPAPPRLRARYSSTVRVWMSPTPLRSRSPVVAWCTACLWRHQAKGVKRTTPSEAPSIAFARFEPRNEPCAQSWKTMNVRIRNPAAGNREHEHEQIRDLGQARTSPPSAPGTRQPTWRGRTGPTAAEASCGARGQCVSLVAVAKGRWGPLSRFELPHRAAPQDRAHGSRPGRPPAWSVLAARFTVRAPTPAAMRIGSQAGGRKRCRRTGRRCRRPPRPGIRLMDRTSSPGRGSIVIWVGSSSTGACSTKPSTNVRLCSSGSSSSRSSRPTWTSSS